MADEFQTPEDEDILFDGLEDPENDGLKLDDSSLELCDLSDSGVSLEVSDLNDSCVAHQFILREPDYWQVPRDSLHILDVLKMHEFQVKKDRKDPKRPNDYSARIFGRNTKVQIADYTVPGTKKDMPTIDETIPLRLIYRYDNTGDFSQINDALELKEILEANKQPYRESGKQELLKKLKYEVNERSGSVQDLNREIRGRSDLVKKLEGEQ